MLTNSTPCSSFIFLNKFPLNNTEYFHQISLKIRWCCNEKRATSSCPELALTLRQNSSHICWRYIRPHNRRGKNQDFYPALNRQRHQFSSRVSFAWGGGGLSSNSHHRYINGQTPGLRFPSKLLRSRSYAGQMRTQFDWWRSARETLTKPTKLFVDENEEMKSSMGN